MVQVRKIVHYTCDIFRLQLHDAIYRPDSFVLMLRYCVNLKAIRYESTSLDRIVADKSHRVIVALLALTIRHFFLMLQVLWNQNAARIARDRFCNKITGTMLHNIRWITLSAKCCRYWEHLATRATTFDFSPNNSEDVKSPVRVENRRCKVSSIYFGSIWEFHNCNRCALWNPVEKNTKYCHSARGKEW